jgi:hypothetical protein
MLLQTKSSLFDDLFFLLAFSLFLSPFSLRDSDCFFQSGIWKKKRRKEERKK